MFLFLSATQSVGAFFLEIGAWIESLYGGNCLVGITGLKPGAMDNVRSP